VVFYRFRNRRGDNPFRFSVGEKSAVSPSVCRWKSAVLVDFIAYRYIGGEDNYRINTVI